MPRALLRCFGAVFFGAVVRAKTRRSVFRRRLLSALMVSSALCETLCELVQRVALALLLCVLLLFTATETLCAQVSSDEAARADEFSASLAAFCFEVTQYCVTGFSMLPQAADFAPLSTRAALILTCPVMRAGGQVRFLYELCAPEKADDFFSATAPSSLQDRLDNEVRAFVDDDETFTEGRDGNDVLAALDNRAGEALPPKSADGLVPRDFVDDADNLRRFSYGVENLSVDARDGMRYLTDSADRQIVRRAYDSRMRLVTTEVFPLPTEARNITRSLLRTLRYRGDALVPFEREDEDFGKQTRTVTAYNAAGLPETRAVFRTEAAPSNDGAASDEAQKSREVQTLRTEWTYDADGRVLSETVTTWQTEATVKGEARTSRVVRREYSYDGAGATPDVDYYEDGTLRIRTVYTGENGYTESLFFDGGFSVETTYVNHNKTLEVILLDGQEQRRRTFAD